MLVLEPLEGAPGFRHLGKFRGGSPIGVEHALMSAGIEQADGLVLAVDFQQVFTQGLQDSDTDRLIVDKGFGAAVARHHTPQQQGFTGFERQSLVFQKIVKRMIAGQLEFGGHRRLCRTGADQARIGARACRQAQAVEQDRFPGARFTGQDAQAFMNVQFEAIDQDNIGNGQTGQHRAAIHNKKRRRLVPAPFH